VNLVRVLCDTSFVVVDVRVERSVPAILQVLRDVAPAEAAQFENEFQDALQKASATFDLTPVNQVVNRWWGIAYLRLNPPTGDEREAARRLRAGEDVGWASAQERLAAQGR
jgi:hypothetical protein